MSDNVIQVRAAQITTSHLILYKTDGLTCEIPQGDERIMPIIKLITPIVTAGGIALVDLGDEATSQAEEQRARYAEYESKSPLMRFFRVAKDVLFGTGKTVTEIPPMEIMPPDPDENQRLLKAVQVIMDNAIPTSNPQFSDEGTLDVNSKDTIIGVVTDTDGKKTVIPGVQALRNQIDHAAKLGSTKAVDAFMSRIAPVMKDRGHSVDDLLNFMQRGDLPIAEDGCIIVYKTLKKHHTNAELFTDVHTGLVPQRVGSYVFVDPSMVDPNRRNECSNGLHIARRGYIRGFNSDAIFLAKVKPEEVIAVPERDADKMRCCGYHLIFQLNDAEYKRIKEDKSFTDNKESRTLLGRAIAGDHPPVNQLVEIRGHGGTDIVVTDLINGEVPVIPKVKVKPVAAIKLDGEEPETPVLNADPVDPTKVLKTVMKAKEKVATNQRQDTAKAMAKAVYEAKMGTAAEVKAAADLIAFKRAAKVSWDKLGLASSIGLSLQDIVDRGVTVVETKPITSTEGKPPTRAEQAEALFQAYHKSRSQKDALALLAFKKAAKVGWDKLGLGLMIDPDQLKRDSE